MATEVEARSQLPATNHGARDIPALDGLRGLAVLLVVWCHIRGFSFDANTQWLLNFKAASGFMGLYLFFALSGFLLFLPYARAMFEHSRWPGVRRFYLRRMLRILPVFYAGLLVPLGLALLAARAGSVAGGNAYVFGLQVPSYPGLRTLVPLLLLLHDLRPQTWSYVLQFNTPLWSLAVEWQYYLMLPLLALGLRALYKRWGARALVFGLLSLMGYGLVVRAIAAATFYHWGYATVMQMPRPAGSVLTVLYGMEGKYLELFALGMLASVGYAATRGLRHHGEAVVTSAARRALSVATVPLLATGAAVLIGLPLNLLWLHAAGLIPTPPQAYVGRWPQEAANAWLWSVAGPWALAVCMAGLLVGALQGPHWLRRLWAWPPLRFVGLISYSLYVWHALLQHLWENLWDAHWAGQPEVLQVAGYLVLLFALAALSYRFIERPFLRARRETIPPMPRWLTRTVAMLGRHSPQETVSA